MSKSISLTKPKSVAELALGGIVYVRYTDVTEQYIIVSALHKQNPTTAISCYIKVGEKKGKEELQKYLGAIEESLTSCGYEVYRGCVNDTYKAFDVQLHLIFQDSKLIELPRPYSEQPQIKTKGKGESAKADAAKE